ncbi:MAG: fumarylacetoacetate hydrolase family protein [Burkholderiales bacterium]|jgi:2-keto-4-pentenoate hydratase/2-oxohepta-3-ene-1,7-dioic acid hydratase in catechol pathway|uniref:fumarylacetoacetate hydrolase family protein n=1 Tax=Limnobacter sp. TaxID=2003368 RepID=UPI00392DE91F|nr:fumarylacetoacetate hydrolase family protein [Burkholderiales bacterium]
MPHIALQAQQTEAVQVRNIFCIGRNYAAHIAELGNRPEEDPVVFIKPTSALHLPGTPIVLPKHSSDVHYEAELVLLIGQGGKNITEDKALKHIAGYGLGLDLTARDLQATAKKGGLPWAIAKGFDCAATVSPFVSAEHIQNPTCIEFEMHLNGQVRQRGDIRKMLFPIPFIVRYLSEVFTLQEGDIIFTGTPEGVGSLTHGDTVRLVLPGHIDTEFEVFDSLN